jgi:hypothetical protein
VKVDLNRIDRLRERIDLSYEEAASYLEAAGGDLVRALIMAEKDAANTRAATRAAGLHETGYGSQEAVDGEVPGMEMAREAADRVADGIAEGLEEGASSLGKLADGIKELWSQGSAMRVVVERDGDRLANLPIAAGVIGAVFAPQLAALSAVAALATGCTVRVQPK